MDFGTPHDSGVGTTPVIVDIDNDNIAEIVAGEFYNDRVYAFNGENGSVVWAYQTGASVWYSPAIGDIDNDSIPEIVFSSHEPTVYAVNGEDGSFLWSFDNVDAGNCPPSIGDVDGDGWLEVAAGGTGPLFIIDQDCPSSVEESSHLIKSLYLSSHSAPFYRSATIKYQLPNSANVSLTIYNQAGRQVCTLLNEHKSHGTYTINWTPNNLPSGIYFAKLTTGELFCTHKLLFIK